MSQSGIPGDPGNDPPFEDPNEDEPGAGTDEGEGEDTEDDNAPLA